MANTQTFSHAAAAMVNADDDLRKEYFLTLKEHFFYVHNNDYGSKEGDDLLYSVLLGKLTPKEAKIIERYAQSFKWAKDCSDAMVKKIIVESCEGEVIFTDDEKDCWDIEFDGEFCDDHENTEYSSFCTYETTLTLVTHTFGEKSVGEISEALSRFNTDEVGRVFERKITRDIMKRCIEAATALRENQPLTLPDKPLTVSPQMRAIRAAKVKKDCAGFLALNYAERLAIMKDKNATFEFARTGKVSASNAEPPIVSPPPQAASSPPKNRKKRGLAKRTELILAEYDRRVACGENSNAESLLAWWGKLPRDKKSGVDEQQISFKIKTEKGKENAIKNIQKMIDTHRPKKK